MSGAPLPPAARLRAWARRVAMITIYASAWLLLLVTLPAMALAAATADLWRGDRRWPTLRCLAFALLYLSCELAGVAAAGALWLATGGGRGRASIPAARLTGLSDAYLRANFRLQCWWARRLFRGAERVFGLRTAVSGDAAVRTGPYLLFVRHASIGDTVLPAVYIGARHGVMLRYVMKRELLWDPCLDIVGNRLPNYFVQRGSGDSQREIAAVQRLVEALGPQDGVLIYPEGTRFSPAKRERVVARLRGALPARLQAHAERLRHTLPPRLGGVLGLLEKNPGADVVFCAHTGFEGAASVRDLLAGALIGRQVRVAFWRVPFASIPRDADGRAEWLYAHWRRIDDWVDAALTAEAAPPRALSA